MNRLTVRRRLWSAAVAVSLACSSMAAVAASGALSAGTPGDVPPLAPAGAGVATAVPQVDAQALGVLARPRTASDAVPAATVFSAASGANVDLSRKVETPNGNVWLVPGIGTLCLMTEGGAACGSAAGAAEGHLVQEENVEGAAPFKPSEFDSIPMEVSGVVPNGVEAVTVHLVKGGASTLTVHENVYMGTVDGAVSAVTFTGPNGPVTVTF